MYQQSRMLHANGKHQNPQSAGQQSAAQGHGEDDRPRDEQNFEQRDQIGVEGVADEAATPLLGHQRLKEVRHRQAGNLSDGVPQMVRVDDRQLLLFGQGTRRGGVILHLVEDDPGQDHDAGENGSPDRRPDGVRRPTTPDHHAGDRHVERDEDRRDTGRSTHRIRPGGRRRGVVGRTAVPSAIHSSVTMRMARGTARFTSEIVTMRTITPGIRKTRRPPERPRSQRRFSDVTAQASHQRDGRYKKQKAEVPEQDRLRVIVPAQQ